MNIFKTCLHVDGSCKQIQYFYNKGPITNNIIDNNFQKKINFNMECILIPLCDNENAYGKNKNSKIYWTFIDKDNNKKVIDFFGNVVDFTTLQEEDF